MRTRGDGALVIHPIDPDVRASTDTGMSTNLETGSASYPTSTFNDTASATTLSGPLTTGRAVPASFDELTAAAASDLDTYLLVVHVGAFS